MPRLVISDCWFVSAPGRLHRRKSLTAFTAPKRVAEGRIDDLRRYLDWGSALGANEIRIFSQTNWDGQGSGVEPGWTYDASACARVLDEAAVRGCYVEVVAHTYAYELEAMVAHLREIDALCLSHPNALLEVANEPGRNNIPLQAILDRYTPKSLWSSGQYDPTPYPSGLWCNYHSPRDDEWPRKFKDAFEFSTGQGPTQPFVPGYRYPIMLDEPPQVERTLSPDDWKAYGAGAALFAAGATLHGFPDFQQCRIPTASLVLACVAAFYEGLTLVPLQRYVGYAHPDDRGSLRRYRRWGEDGRCYEISVRPFSFGVV